MEFVMRRSEWGAVVLAWVSTVFVGGCAAHFTETQAKQSTIVARRAKLDNFTAYGNNPELLVGHLLYVKSDESGKCPDNRVYDVDHMSLNSYLVKDTKLEARMKSEIIYQGNIQGGTSVSPAIASFSAQIAASAGIELVVTDVREVVVDNAAIDNEAVHKVEQTALPKGICARILIRNVAVSLVHLKRYQKASSKLNFTGTAFGVGADIFESSDIFEPDYIIGMDIYKLEEPGAFKPLGLPHVEPAFQIRTPTDGFREM